MMKILFPIFLFLSLTGLNNQPNYCVCREEISQIKDNSDLVVIGKFTKQIPFGKYDKGINSNGYFKIDSVIKGPSDLQNIVVNQFPSGNCRQLFEEEKEYLITGYHITEFKYMDYSNKQVPPPLGNIRNSIMECYAFDKKTLKKWNKISKDNYVVFTNQCLTFNLKSKFADKNLEN